jgi:hypothetical protein
MDQNSTSNKRMISESEHLNKRRTPDFEGDKQINRNYNYV